MKLFKKKTIMGCDERGDGNSPYLTRFTIIEGRLGALYLHRFHRSDADEMHDHPWPFVSLIVWRGYVEETPLGGKDAPDAIYMHGWQSKREQRRAWPGMVLFRRARHIHRVQLLKDKRGREREAWTIVARGPYCRPWGFWTPSGWENFKSYFLRRGC